MRILMVCLGNICRSPLAHGVMQQLVGQAGLDWEIDSAGTGSWHVGDAPDPRAIAVARRHGVDISEQRGQHFNAGLYEEFDRIFVMDRSNYRDVVKLAQSEAQRSKVSLFLDDDEVPDPYYDDTMFDPVYAMVEVRSRELLDKLRG